MAYIHGGAYTNGSSYAVDLDGEALAARGAVVVTMAYRLGTLGFFAHPDISAENGGFSGNQAIGDVQEALRWIQKNISAFGGDPGRLTIFGQSAGGDMTNRLICSPKSKGLFHRAIGPQRRRCSHYRAGAHTVRSGIHRWSAYARKLGKTVAELRAMPPYEALMAINNAGWQLGLGLRLLSPIIDGDILTRYTCDVLKAGEELDVDLMCGATLGDAFLFSYGYDGFSPEGYKETPDPQIAASSCPKRWRCWETTPRSRSGCVWQPTHIATVVCGRKNEIKKGRKPMRIFSFERLMPGDNAGAYHAADLLYVFGTLERCWRATAPNGFVSSDCCHVQSYGTLLG